MDADKRKLLERVKKKLDGQAEECAKLAERLAKFANSQSELAQLVEQAVKGEIDLRDISEIDTEGTPL